VSTYVRWFWPDDGTWNYEELDADRWPTRHVEIREDATFVAAASLAEVLAARDSGEPGAVSEYQARYGVVPEGPLPEQSAEYPLEPASADEFESLWRNGRATLAARAGWSLQCEAVEWVDTDWPGWIKVRLIDAGGRAWFLVDKVAVFGFDFGPETELPAPVALYCEVVGDDGDQTVVVTPRWDVQAEDGTSQFRVGRNQLERIED
jgi:hypothetical protein